MSLTLNIDSPTTPSCKTLPDGTIQIGKETIGIFDFLMLVDYVMTNSDLDERDPRLHLIDYFGSLEEVPGWNPERRKLGTDLSPVPGDEQTIEERAEALARQRYTTRHPHWDELKYEEKAPLLFQARQELVRYGSRRAIIRPGEEWEAGVRVIATETSDDPGCASSDLLHRVIDAVEAVRYAGEKPEPIVDRPEA